jgi:hypothetical protein
MPSRRAFSPGPHPLFPKCLLAAALVWLTLCRCTGVRVSPQEQLVFKYAEGIQSLHQPTYDDFFLACHPDWEQTDLVSRMARYEAGRRTGSIEFSNDGVELVKLAALGRGAYFKVERVVTEAGRLQFRTIVKPDYIAINSLVFPEGAIVYILGEPLGTVLPMRPGKTPGPQRSALWSVELHWIWVPNPLAKSDWCLYSVALVPGTEVFRKMAFNEAPGPQTPGGANAPEEP